MATLYAIQSGNIDGGINPSNHTAPFVNPVTVFSAASFADGYAVTLTVNATAGLAVGQWVQISIPSIAAAPATPSDYVGCMGLSAPHPITAVGQSPATISLVLAGGEYGYLQYCVTTQGLNHGLVAVPATPGNGDACYILSGVTVTQTQTASAALSQLTLCNGHATLQDDGHGNPLAAASVILEGGSTLDGLTILGSVADDAKASGSPMSLAPVRSVTVLGSLSVTNSGSLIVGNDTLTNRVTLSTTSINAYGPWVWAGLATPVTISGSSGCNSATPSFSFANSAPLANFVAGSSVVVYGQGAMAGDLATLAGGGTGTVGIGVVASINATTNQITLAGGTHLSGAGPAQWLAVINAASVSAVTDGGNGNATIQIGGSVAGFATGASICLGIHPVGIGGVVTDFGLGKVQIGTVTAAMAPSYAPSGAGLSVYGGCVLAPQQPIIQCGPIRVYAPLLPAPNLVARGNAYGYSAAPLAQTGALAAALRTGILL
jgi:hypothetical protein